MQLFETLTKLPSGTKVLWRGNESKKWKKGKVVATGFFADELLAGYKVQLKDSDKVRYLPFGSEETLIKARK